MQLQSKLRRAVPPSILRWMRQQIQAMEARKRAQRRKDCIARFGTFAAADLVKILCAAGIRRNGVLFVQCSFNDLYTYRGTPFELLCALRELAGPDGTLVMPAYSANMQHTPCKPFDVRFEPTTSGILAELFRRDDGVIRSLHPRHSLCASGPYAKELLAKHEDCIYADGPGSPFDRLRHLEAQSLCLGMAPGFTSFIHWVEDIEPDKYPIRAHEGPFECLLTNEDGQQLTRSFYRRISGQRKREKRMGRSLSKSAMRVLSVHGVTSCVYAWPALADELIALRNRGIVYYD